MCKIQNLDKGDFVRGAGKRKPIMSVTTRHLQKKVGIQQVFDEVVQKILENPRLLQKTWPCLLSQER